MPETRGIKFTDFSHLFNLNCVAVNAPVTSVRNIKKGTRLKKKIFQTVMPSLCYLHAGLLGFPRSFLKLLGWKILKS